MIVRLQRYVTTEESGGLRGEGFITGVTDSPPTIGDSFAVMCAPVVPEATGRLVITSPIVELDGLKGFGWEFKTQTGSRYVCEFLKG